jgi:hypothetical protein
MILALCDAYRCLPSAALAEDAEAIQLLRIAATRGGDIDGERY